MQDIPSFDSFVARLPDTVRTRPWLIVGKGPTHAKFSSEHASTHNILALNHAMRGARALVGHAIDAEVFEQIGEADIGGVEYLCLPWIPHVRSHPPFYGGNAFFGPGHETLAELAVRIPVLRRYRDQGRLCSYNLVSAKPSQRRPDLPLIEGHTFSAAIALRMVAHTGARTIRTLGVDGGSYYSPTFRDIEPTTKLQTSQTSFDSQFEEMALTIREHGLTCGPFDVDLPVRIFVGCMPEQDLAYLVLKYSVRRHASLSVEVQRLDEMVARKGIVIPIPVDQRSRGRTPFSFQRFAIPALCDYSGRALYVDSDMLVLKDVRSLWTHDMADHQMVSVAEPASSGRRPQFSVLLLDCERLRWNVADLVKGLDENRWSYEALMYQMASVESWEASLPPTWNSLESHQPGQTHLVHFTDMDGQPWLNAFHKLGPLWVQYLLDAIRDGDISIEKVMHEVEKGNIRPSLLEQVRRYEPDARRLPFATLVADFQRFSPPHRRSALKISRVRHELYRARLIAGHLVRERLIGSARRTGRLMVSALRTALTR